MFVASDLSEKTKKEWAFKAPSHAPAAYAIALTKEEIGLALGTHGPVGLVAVCDEGFANAIRESCPTMKEE